MSDVQRIVEIIKGAGELETLDASQDFYKAGIDSMKAMDVMLQLETDFGVTIPDERFIQARTADALASLVDALRAE
jgi:acyl carrier protein